MTTYGHLHLGFWFRPIVTVEDDSMVFHNRRYAWDDITAIDQTPPGALYVFGYPAGKPRASIRFRDGAVLRIDGSAFTQEGQPPHLNFWSSASEAFVQFIALVRLRAGMSSTP